MKTAKLVIKLDQQTMLRLWEVARRYDQTPVEFVKDLIYDALDAEELAETLDPATERVLLMVMPALLAEDDDWERRERR